MLKKLGDGKFRFYYTDIINNSVEQSKFVATKEDLVIIKNALSDNDIIEACTKDWATTKWKIYKLTDVTVFAAQHGEVPMGCKDAVLPEPLSKSYTVDCLTYKENTRKLYSDNLCLFRAIAVKLHGNVELAEETWKRFNLFLDKIGGSDPAIFQGVCMNNNPIVEDWVEIKIFL